MPTKVGGMALETAPGITPETAAGMILETATEIDRMKDLVGVRHLAEFTT